MSGGSSAAAPGPERDAGTGDAAAGAAPGTPAARDTPRARQPPPAAGADAFTHADFLITSEDRAAAEDRLRRAVADDVLSLEEFGDRMRLLLDARTRGDLHAAVAGLPTDAVGAGTVRRRQGDTRPARTGGSAIAILGSAETRGRWRPGESTTALAALGTSVIDLQGVEFDGDELVITAIAALGEVVIIVPEGLSVDMRGVSLLGERRIEIDGRARPDAPVVRIDGLALLGEVTVRHPQPTERLAVDAGGRSTATVPRRAASSGARRREPVGDRRSALRRRAAGVLAAIVLALPIGWTLTADEVAGAVFGSTAQTVSAAQIPQRGYSVGVPVAFGSVEVRVPEGVNVERDGVVIFGSTDCAPCGADVAGAPTVQIRTAGAFGSVNVVRSPMPGAR